MPKQTGPASQNAAKHHLTSRTLFIEGESPRDFEILLASWQTDYPADTTEAAKLVQEAALSEWFLLRVQRQSDPIFNELFHSGMANWDDAQHKRYQLTQRYLTAAERKLDRNRRNILQYRRELRADAREKREIAKSSPPEPEAPPEPKPKRPRIPEEITTEETQLAFVRVENGVMSTVLNPSNEEMRRTAHFYSETCILRRVINFHCDQLPEEYAWCAPKIAHLAVPLRQCSVLVVHTMRSFLAAAEREDLNGGHVKEWPDHLPEEDQLLIEEFMDTICQP